MRGVIPRAFSSEGALEASGGQLVFACNVLTLNKMGVDAPLKVNCMRQFVLLAASCGEERKKSLSGPTHSAAHFEWAFLKKRPNFSGTGLRSFYAEDGLNQFDHPRIFLACQAERLGDAADLCFRDPEKIVVEMHAIWGHLPAQQLSRKTAHRLANLIQRALRLALTKAMASALG